MDGDGHDVTVDCDDGDATSYPGAPELCDGVDNDCDTVVPADEVDGDLDGVMECDSDCDDADPDVYPSAPDLCDDVLDNDCDGSTDPMEADTDADGDSTCDGDCDDADPGANLDDVDSDGYDTCADDCDDGDPTVHPTAADVCDDVLDNDCDGVTDPQEADADSDTWTVCDGDCDDTLPGTYPHAIENPQDGHDDNCDGLDYCEDLNCDGWTDIVFANYVGSFSWIYWGGPSGFSSGNRSNLPTVGAWDVQLGDVDADGYVDIVVGNYDADNIWIYYGSSGSYSSSNRGSVPCGGAAGLSLDFMNSDNMLDLVCSGYTYNSSFELQSPVYWNSGGSFIAGNAGYYPTFAAFRNFTGEITGDSHVDLVHTSHHNNAWNHTLDSNMYPGSGAGPQTSGSVGFETSGASDVDAGYVNNDAYPDLVVVSFFDEDEQPTPFNLDSYVYWGSGSSSWNAGNRSAFPTIGASQVTLVEINSDSDVDMVVSNHDNGTTVSLDSYVWWGTGGGYSVGSRLPLATVGAWGHAVGDLDDDGDIDIIFANAINDAGSSSIDSYLYYNVGNTWPVGSRVGLPTNGSKNVAISGPGAEVPRSY